MLHKTVVVSVLLLFPLNVLAQATDPGRTWQDVELTTRDGWVYKGVQVAVDPSDQNILVVTRSDGSFRRMGVSEIRMIRDADGLDITSEIIPTTTDPTSYSEVGAAAPTTDTSPPGPKPFSVMLTAGVGYGHPFYNFYESMQDRVSWHVELRAPLSETTYLAAVYRYQQLFRGDVDYYDPDSAMLIPIDTSIDLKELLFFVGFLGKPNPNNGARAYLELGGGPGNHVATASYGGESGSDSFSRFLLVAQFGALVGFGQSDVGLDIGMSLAAKIFNSEPGESSGFISGAHAGLTYAFGTP